MKNLKQIESVKLLVNIERQRYLNEINMLQKRIQTKMDYIKKLIDYKAEYDDLMADRPSYVIPALNLNLTNFVVKINDLVLKEKDDIELITIQLDKSKLELLKLNKNIEFHDKEIKKINMKLEDSQERRHQQLIEDTVSFKEEIK